MKRLILLILILLPAGLFAQDRYITILEKDAPALKQYKINWHTGIDPVQIKDGSWVLPEIVLPLIPEKIRITVDEKEVIVDLKIYLVTATVVTLIKLDFKNPEPIVKEVEPIIIKK